MTASDARKKTAVILDVLQGLMTKQMMSVIEILPRRRFLEVPIKE